MRKLLQANLEAVGLDLQGAVNGHHGLHLVSQEIPDLILLGTDLPDMDTRHLLERLHTQLSGQVPIIILSAEPPSRSLRQHDRATSFLLKPFAIPDLLQSIGRALDGVPSDTEGTSVER